MSEASDGVVEAVFGVVTSEGCYEARHGQLEFRGGRLVGVWCGHQVQWRDEGLTIGLVIFPAPHSRARNPPARSCACTPMALSTFRPTWAR
jgi:hypothetical protein